MISTSVVPAIDVDYQSVNEYSRFVDRPRRDSGLFVYQRTPLDWLRSWRSPQSRRHRVVLTGVPAR
jgi:hypothetical protein